MSDKSYLVDIVDDGFMEFNSIKEIKDHLQDMSCDDGFPIAVDDCMTLFRSCGTIGIKTIDTKEDCLKRGEEWEYSEDFLYIGEWDVQEDTTKYTLAEIQEKFEEYSPKSDNRKDINGEYTDFNTYKWFKIYLRAFEDLGLAK